MNDYQKTGLFVGGALLLTLLATLTGPRPVRLEQFADEGQDLFPDFKDAAAATELEVTEFSEATSAVYKFSVKQDDTGHWIIPSHDGYPADAKQRMGKAAAMLIGLKKDRVVGGGKDDHPKYDVVDPFDQTTAETKGRGRRLTMKDKAGNVLADLIIGKTVEGKTDMHYVRLPDKRRVYAAKFDDQVSTRFADWIETDLLKAQSWDITGFVFDNYKVDEQQGTIVPGERIAAKKDDSSKWGIDGQKDDEQPNDEKLNEITRTLGEIKIVGVRRKPEGLTAALRQASGIDRLALGQMLAQKGYYLTRDGRLVSNEGDLLFQTRKGIVYTLKFGEVAAGEGDALTAGKDDARPAKPADGQAAKPADGQPVAATAPAGNHRFLMVTAEFDESLLKKPSGLRLPDDELKKRQEARTAIEAIVKAVDAYKEKHDKKLPDALAALCEKPAEGEPLLKELKKDPWEQDYTLSVQGDTFAIVSHGADKQEGGEGAAADIRSDQLTKEDDLRRATDEWKEYDRKLDDGKKEAANLTKRFGSWYYVISADLFQKLKPARKDLVKPKDKPPEKPPEKPGDKPGKSGETPLPGNGGDPPKEPGK